MQHDRYGAGEQRSKERRKGALPGFDAIEIVVFAAERMPENRRVPESLQDKWRTGRGTEKQSDLSSIVARSGEEQRRRDDERQGAVDHGCHPVAGVALRAGAAITEREMHWQREYQESSEGAEQHADQCE